MDELENVPRRERDDTVRAAIRRILKAEERRPGRSGRRVARKGSSGALYRFETTPPNDEGIVSRLLLVAVITFAAIMAMFVFWWVLSLIRD